MAESQPEIILTVGIISICLALPLLPPGKHIEGSSGSLLF